MNNFISKIFTTIAFVASSAFVILIIYWLSGAILGNILHSSHEHHYECVCDQGSMLTILEACILGVICLALILFLHNYILRKMEFEKIERIIVLILLFLSNLYICYQVGIVLYSPPIS